MVITDPVVAPPPHRCTGCGKMMHQVLIDQGAIYHPTCDPQVVFDQRNAELRDQVISLVEWTDANAARSLQVEIGPSEMGNPCDQQIARRLANMPQVNFRIDPWPAIMGTAVHQWLEKAVARYQKDFPEPTPVRKWETEVELPIDAMINGHTDLYTHEHDVVDWKTAGPDRFATMRKHGPPPWYKIQCHLYGYAHEQAGRPVRDVVLAFLPRAGKLKDMFLWREKYDRRIAVEAIRRTYKIGEDAIAAGVLEDPQNWALVPTLPGEYCWHCPFFVDRPAEYAPDALGCPGRSKSAEDRRNDSLARFNKGLV